ncbi:MAG: hypothetical protein E7508_01965 [Ruminococcus sp.]|nr:hypothetical protein [Ruminococcus sp.]
MFVKENVSERYKEDYEQISERSWYEKLSDWVIDREKNIVIVAIGKRGVETPVFFHMLFKQKKIEFWIWEVEYNYSIIDVKIPSVLKNYKWEIKKEICCAYRETNRIANNWSLPESIDNCTFEFEII